MVTVAFHIPHPRPDPHDPSSSPIRQDNKNGPRAGAGLWRTCVVAICQNQTEQVKRLMSFAVGITYDIRGIIPAFT
jgi:hypothetical protein